MINDASIIARDSPSGNDNGIAVTSQSGMEASAEIRNSIIRGSVIAANVDSSGTPAVIKIAASTVDGSVSPGPLSEIKCVGAFDTDFNALDTDCLAIP